MTTICAVAVNSDTAPKQIAGLSGGVLNVCGNLSSIRTPIAIGYIIQSRITK